MIVKHLIFLFVCTSIFVMFGSNKCSAQAIKKAKMKTTIDDHSFIYGVNLPWFEGQFGHDLGPEPQFPNNPVWYDGGKVSGYFQEIDDIGFTVVRIWLMERAEGWKVDNKGYVTGLDETFLKNLDDLVERAGVANLKLYLCLTCSWDEVKYPSPIKDMKQQNAYLKHAVKPLLTAVEKCGAWRVFEGGPKVRRAETYIVDI